MSKKIKRNYKVDNAEMTITADWTKLNAVDKATVKEFIDLGYKFQNKNSRNGSKRTVEYYENNLYEADRMIFDELRNEKGKNGKTKKGAYSKASSFASTIIKLGKYVDENPEEEGVIDEYRNLIIEDYVKAKVFAEGVLKAA